jgi:hypothetical protein
LIERSENNTFFHNNLIDNKRQADDYKNVWDNGVEGNYWSDYSGSDSDGDGIGDTPYYIPTDAQDRYPLMAPYLTETQIRTLYYQLQRQLKNLTLNYDNLNTAYNALLANLTALQTNYNSLLNSYNNQQTTLSEMQTNLQTILNELENTKLQTNILIATIAALIATTIYIAIRTRKTSSTITNTSQKQQAKAH